MRDADRCGSHEKRGAILNLSIDTTNRYEVKFCIRQMIDL